MSARILRFLAWGGVIGFILANLWILFPRLQQDVSFTLQNPNLSPSQKWKLTEPYASVYGLAELITQTTSPTSTILIPDVNNLDLQTIWFDASNPYLMTGFLYPRKVVFASSTTWDTDWQEDTHQNVYIVVLSRKWDGQVYTWPVKRPSESSIVYANAGGWGYAPVSR